MGSPSVPYLMLADGYKVTSGSNGFRAQASFLVGWGDAFAFHDEVMGYATAAVVGPLTYNTPWQFPGSSTARLYASSCEITPIALDGSGLPITAALGMAPGEFWSHARLDVQFETPASPQSAADDPGNQNQIDPAAPIYNCQQSIRIGTKTETRPKSAYKFTGGTTEPAEDPSIFTGETNITIHHEFLPFNPWRKYRPFISSVNDATFMDCGVGELMCQGIDIQPAQGAQGTLGNSLTITLVVNDRDWNKFPVPGTGTFTTIETKTGSTKPYVYKDFRQLLLG